MFTLALAPLAPAPTRAAAPTTASLAARCNDAVDTTATVDRVRIGGAAGLGADEGLQEAGGVGVAPDAIAAGQGRGGGGFDEVFAGGDLVTAHVYASSIYAVDSLVVLAWVLARREGKGAGEGGEEEK